MLRPCQFNFTLSFPIIISIIRIYELSFRIICFVQILFKAKIDYHLSKREIFLSNKNENLSDVADVDPTFLLEQVSTANTFFLQSCGNL